MLTDYIKKEWIKLNVEAENWEEAIEKGGEEIEVLVDNNTALENVTRLAQSRGFKVATNKCPDGEWQILINRGE